MDSLPLDILRVIASYTDIHELGHLRVVSKDFEMIDLCRHKRFEWCLATLRGHQRTFATQRSCVDHLCDKMKAVCITIDDNEMDEPRVQTLSNYCSHHAREYYDLDINDFIDFMYND